MGKQGMLQDLQMPKSRRLILVALKEHGNMTADALATMLNISAVAVRRHLENLKHADLIQYEEVRQGMGRPSFVYSLTSKANHIFPRNYEDLAHDMLDAIRDLYGQEAVDAIFAKRFKKIKAAYSPQINAQTLTGRLEQLVELRRSDGYMASWATSDEDIFVLTELNCPIQNVAEGCCQACEQDLQLFSDLLDANVTRQDHLIQGDHACSYMVTPKE